MPRFISLSRVTSGLKIQTQARLLNSWYSIRHISSQERETLNVSHSRFIAEASPANKWSKGGRAGTEPTTSDFGSITEGKGKVSPTSSHLFKFILPLGRFHKNSLSSEPHSDSDSKSSPPVVMLLHPSQPLSHAARLITASLTTFSPSIAFRSTSRTGQTFEWSDSTDIGDFIKDAARDAEFSIHIKPENGDETVIRVEVPTFADRTRFLQRRLDLVNRELDSMAGLKLACDKEARKGARRMALGGFGMLVVYWGAVARLTFWDYGWDIMEPITYLSGLSTVICGYLWFLYQGREVSYSSVLDRSVSARREALYKARGLDIERWVDLMGEAKSLRREIRMIAEDYDEGEKEKKAEAESEEREEHGKDRGGAQRPTGTTDTSEEKAAGKTRVGLD
ncbi:hypothetical protein BV22DRAFT_1005004 [Leucogyrophana mollusca]|uniref:Uncharacterized protein n=1 Tax=Leucogyrophana mollusca TaxID=85980 RepID=A0ACB8BQY9_9AGAM|nr:hypothetical protein BV22DRAFT_1005004 [Leucogyrophana mollusca]